MMTHRALIDDLAVFVQNAQRVLFVTDIRTNGNDERLLPLPAGVHFDHKGEG